MLPASGPTNTPGERERKGAADVNESGHKSRLQWPGWVSRASDSWAKPYIHPAHQHRRTPDLIPTVSRTKRAMNFIVNEVRMVFVLHVSRQQRILIVGTTPT